MAIKIITENEFESSLVEGITLIAFVEKDC